MTFGEFLAALTTFGLPPTVLGTVFLFARAMDKRLRPIYRRQMTRLMVSYPEKSPTLAVDAVAAILDFIFGARRIHLFQREIILPSFIRSYLASVLTSSVLLYIYLIYFQYGQQLWYLDFRNAEIQAAQRDVSMTTAYLYSLFSSHVLLQNYYVQDGCVLGSTYYAIVPLFGVLSAILVANPILDFAAIVSTRNIVESMRRRVPRTPKENDKKPVKILYRLAAMDAAFTTFLVLIIFPTVSRILFAIFSHFNVEDPETGEPYFPEDVLDVGSLSHPLQPASVGESLTRIENFYYYFFGIAPEGVNGAYIYSTYLTSMWIWFVFFGILAGAVAARLNAISLFALRYLVFSRDVLRRPCQTSVVFAFIVCAGLILAVTLITSFLSGVMLEDCF
ncbi:MAG: hypothetical protein ACE37J_08945 [Pikeienuella sp.]|uniref:hypothetical protein n=1 Tax=Pikeienuella sp. TaxID=2831957 RepID=UPI00391A01A1